MTLVGWAQIALVLALVLAAAIPLSGYIARVSRARTTSCRRFCGPSSAASIGSPASIRDARAELVRLYDGDARLQRRRLRLALRDAAAAERAAAQSAGLRRGARRSRLQHVDQLHHQHQLAELRRRDDDESSHADARAHGPQFPLRRDRPRHGLRAGARLRALGGDDGRQFLGRSDAASTLYVLLPISIVVALALVALGVPQTLAGSVEATTLEGAKQIDLDRPGGEPGERSRSSAPTAAASSTPIPRIRSRTPTPGRTSRDLGAAASSRSPAFFAFGRAVGDLRQGRAIAHHHGHPARRRRRSSPIGPRARGNPLLTALGVDPSPGNMEGKEVRFGTALSALFAVATTGTSTGAVNRHARFVHAARRPRAAVQPAGRLHLAGRRRRGPLWLPRPRRHRGLRRRPDGRPHAGISRQEDRERAR